MKKSIILTVAALAPLNLYGQSPSAGVSEAIVTPAPSPAVPRLDEVTFDGETLRDVVFFLKAQAEAAGLNPKTEPLNFVISPGFEALCVPALSLRNVTPAEALSVVTTVLGLRMEPVPSEDAGRVVAWLIKGQQAPKPSTVESVVPQPQNPTAIPSSIPGADFGGGGTDTATRATDTSVQSGAGFGTGLQVPVPMTIASSGLPEGRPVTAVSPAPAARVFGIAQMLYVTDPDSDQGKKQRVEKFERLVASLRSLSQDQGFKTDIRAYGEMDILVVKSTDPAGMSLIAEAIEAMKSNAAPPPPRPASTGGGNGDH